MAFKNNLSHTAGGSTGRCTACGKYVHWYRSKLDKRVKVCLHDDKKGIRCANSAKPVMEYVPDSSPNATTKGE